MRRIVEEAERAVSPGAEGSAARGSYRWPEPRRERGAGVGGFEGWVVARLVEVFFLKKSEEIKVGTWPINIFEPELITLAP
jgi:hypothetical protein